MSLNWDASAFVPTEEHGNSLLPADLIPLAIGGRGR